MMVSPMDRAIRIIRSTIILSLIVVTGLPSTISYSGEQGSEACNLSEVTSVASSDVASSEPLKPYLGIWISSEEIARLPIHGTAWDNIRSAAAQDPGEPDLSEMSQTNDVYVLAKALVYARTGENNLRNEVIENLCKAIGTEKGGTTLALGRNLVSYVIAADLINLPANPEIDQTFRLWLKTTLAEKLERRTLVSTHELRPNNWGTHAGASRAAVARYLGDQAELERTALVFQGWLGDREAYDGFDYGRLSWQADRQNPVGINPKGAVIDGQLVDGALPEEMRRGGDFTWPPIETGYAWEGLQGALVQAQVLHRAGYPAWQWQDKALLRAVQFLYRIGWKAEGDDTWQPWLINYVYDEQFPTTMPTQPGKNMGWTEWTHIKTKQPNCIER